MKTNILAALTLNGLCVAAHAQGSITLYGIADAGLGYSSNQAVTQVPGKSGQPAINTGGPAFALASGTMSGSRWGLAGNEDLGGGVATIFKLESGFNIGNGKLNQGGREFGMQAWMGLTDATRGALTLGRQYDSVVDFVGSIGPSSFLTGVAAHPGDLDNIDNQSRTGNSIKYATPKFGGFQFGALYAFGGQTGSAKDQSTWSVGGQFKNGPFAIGAAYLFANNANGTTGNTWTSSYDGTFASSVNVGFQSAKSMQVIAAASTYQLSAVTFGVSYSNTQYAPGAFSLFRNTVTFNSAGATATWQVTPATRIGLGYSYTRGSSIDGASAPNYNQFNLSSYYALSTRTVLYGLVGFQKAGGTTLDAYGNLVAATASVGDAANGASAAGHNQVLVRIGIHQAF